MRDWSKVELCQHLNYIDFYYGPDYNKPTRVYGCAKYGARIEEFLENIFDEIEEEFKQLELLKK